MIHIVAAVLVLWEPLHFAAEALGVFPTIVYRGVLAWIELAVHGGVAAFSAAAGLALINGSPDGRRLARIAILIVMARTIQSLYLSVLPGNTPPGLEPVYGGVAVAAGLLGIALLRRRS